MKAKATSFATFKDLRGYIQCRDGGGDMDECLNKGDNGEGCFGDTTATSKVAMVAIPKAEMIKRFPANWKKARGKQIRVTLANAGHGKPFVAEVRDMAPVGIVDLNPGALLAAGLDIETELSAKADWEWV